MNFETISFRKWLESLDDNHFSWVKSMLKELHAAVSALNKNLMIGSNPHFQLTKNIQGSLSKFHDGLSSDLQIENMLGRFIQDMKTFLRSPDLGPNIKSNVRNIHDIADRYYNSAYGSPDAGSISPTTYGNSIHAA
jgi:hypothetical protein